ncbi:MAG: DUF368 domain-containing protein [Treponema sp.]|nr:DUF368 domain-containing protein [Treponema sp.]
MTMLFTFLKGIIVGMCNVIPGVSGGTVIVIFDIYDEFLSILSLNLKKTIKNWRFVVPILLGMLVGVLIFSKLVTILYSKFPVQTNFCFTGLILGSIPLLFGYTFGKNKKMSESQKLQNKSSLARTVSSIICVLVGLAVIIAFYILKQKLDVNTDNYSLPPFTWSLALIIFLAGIMGAVTMIVPGISGSLVMLIMGVYPIIITAIPSLFIPEDFVHALILLLPNGLGVIAGLIGGAWLIKFLLRKFQSQTYAVILGLIVGSVINVFPGFKAITSFGQGLGSVLALLAGAALAYFGSKTPKHNDEVADTATGQAE